MTTQPWDTYKHNTFLKGSWASESLHSHASLVVQGGKDKSIACLLTPALLVHAGVCSTIKLVQILHAHPTLRLWLAPAQSVQDYSFNISLPFARKCKPVVWKLCISGSSSDRSFHQDNLFQEHHAAVCACKQVFRSKCSFACTRCLVFRCNGFNSTENSKQPRTRLPLASINENLAHRNLTVIAPQMPRESFVKAVN